MKCPKCGTETTGNFCQNCGAKIQPTPSSETEAVSNPKSHTFRTIVIFLIVAGLFIWLGVFLSQKNICSRLTKEQPSITYSQTLSGFDFKVYAKDNYDEVKISYTVYNGSKQVIKQGTVTGSNYVKGNTYTLSVSLSFSELLNADTFTYRLESYK